MRLVLHSSGWLPSYVTQRALKYKVVRGVMAQIELPAGAAPVTDRPREELGQADPARAALPWQRGLRPRTPASPASPSSARGTPRRCRGMSVAWTREPGWTRRFRYRVLRMSPGCAAWRASFTTPGLTDHFDNSAGPAIEALQLDLILFNQEGVIARRLAVDTAPLRAVKRRRRW